jgi:predicted ABC-type transport system involved in lysophospholipase L1 biosynthesis ATPase subunit
MKIDIHKECDILKTNRVEMLSSMFEVPINDKLHVSLTGEVPLDGSRDYNIGLIVGPSGSGKTLILNQYFGVPEDLEWGSRSVIDDFPSVCTMEDISRVCQSVGFNTIPAWLRPYNVLSNGEKFRASIARHLLDNRFPITIDEYTSVVDRQVAQITCHAVQKYVREKNKRLVVASCHYDIIDWLQPDWILEPSNPCKFTWRSLQRRPPINVSISRVKYETWKLFREFHYMSADLNRAARCYGIFVSTPAAVEGYGGRTDGGDPSDESSPLRRKSKEENNPTTNSGRERTKESTGTSEHTNPEESAAGMDLQIPNQELRSRKYWSGNITRADTGSRIPSAVPVSVGHSDMVFRADDASDTTTTTPSDETSNIPTAISTIQQMGTDVPKSTGGYRIASMCGVLYRPHPRVNDIYGFTRMVTLPDFQGLGLAFVLATTVASAYKALGKRLHSYPNHPAWIRSYQRSRDWMQVKNSGTFSPRAGNTSSVGGFGGRRCAVFMYIGPAMNPADAAMLINGGIDPKYVVEGTNG